MVSNTCFSSLFLVIAFCFLCPSSPVTAATSPSQFSKIYAFGDSYTDTGNTRSATGPSSYGHVSNPPYGITYFHVPTNRYSDGRLVVDFLSETLSLPFIPPYKNRTSDFTNGVDFAVAGSTAIGYEFFVKNNATVDITPVSLQTQLVWFNRFLEEKKSCRKPRSIQCRMAMKDAIFWVGEIGANDYAYAFASQIPTNTIQKLATDSVAAVVQALVKKGAKYIVVQGLPLIGCLPLSLYLASPDDRDSLGCVNSENKVANAHNAILQAKLKELRRHYPNVFISYADYWTAHLEVMKNPGRYGFTETLKNCCGSGGGLYNFDLFKTCGSPAASKPCSDPSKFVNWDGVHLTEAMYKVVADMFFRGGFCHPSFDLLLDGKRRGG